MTSSIRSLRICSRRGLGGVLGGDDDGVDAHGAAVFVVLHGDLGLAVGPQIVHQALLADLGQALGQLVAQGDGQGHQLRGLVAGVAEHHALVAGAAHLVVGAQGDVGGLLVDAGDDAAGVAVEAVLGPVIADVPHHVPDDLGDVHIALGADLAHHVDKAGGHGGLAGHAAVGVVFQDGVQHRVGDLVADLIGMSLGDGLGSKEIVAHIYLLVLYFPISDWKKKTRAVPDSARQNCLFSLIFRLTAGFGTLSLLRLPGFTGPFPPPLLIRCSIVEMIIAGRQMSSCFRGKGKIIRATSPREKTRGLLGIITPHTCFLVRIQCTD